MKIEKMKIEKMEIKLSRHSLGSFIDWASESWNGFQWIIYFEFLLMLNHYSNDSKLTLN